MYDHEIEIVREAWNKCGIPKLPKGIIRKIPRLLRPRNKQENEQKHSGNSSDAFSAGNVQEPRQRTTEGNGPMVLDR
ncbi:MAG: hypothetical protein DMG65_20465 [Candidatus Angelobacter sp. Gp1-AA117]|nr:MAG: hypothetical protein DMG65_20465 [Candidatus Angelobacter sp. Gp1-AA117]